MEVSLHRTAYCGPNGVLIIEVSLYRTAYCGSSGVLIIEVSLYRTAYCGPSGVLIVEVHCTGQLMVVSVVSLLIIEVHYCKNNNYEGCTQEGWGGGGALSFLKSWGGGGGKTIQECIGVQRLGGGGRGVF